MSITDISVTANKRVYASGLMDEFDSSLHDDQQKKEILRWLKIDEPSTGRIVK